MGRARSFRELRVYRESFRLATEIFRRSGEFPDTERYGLVSQARRSSRSVCANLAEAWRRRRYPAAFVAKLIDAEAEATETRVHVEIACACGYLPVDEARRLDLDYDRLLRQIARMRSEPGRWVPGRHDPGSPRRGQSRVTEQCGARDPAPSDGGGESDGRGEADPSDGALSGPDGNAGVPRDASGRRPSPSSADGARARSSTQ